MDSHQRFFVVTGGPGAGKTSLLNALKAQGFACMEEAGRAIIRDQAAIGGPALPWADADAFAEQMLGFDMRTYRLAEETAGLALFDRGIPDIVGYRRLAGLFVPPHLEAAAKRFRYNTRVLVAPPWPEIFAQDEERKQTLQEAQATFHAMTRVYAELGYEIVELPRASIAVRAAFVAEILTGNANVSESLPS